MAKHRFAKYKYADEPAIREMLTKDRVTALEKTLALIQVKLAQSQSQEERNKYLEKRQDVETLLARAKKLLAPATTSASHNPFPIVEG